MEKIIDTFVNFLSSFFDWVINTTIMASILVVLILGVKTLLRNKLTPRWHYLLWMILVVRLLLPWSPESSYSIYSILSNSYAAVSSIPTQSNVSLKHVGIHETTNAPGDKVFLNNGQSVHRTLQTTMKETNKGTSNTDTTNAENLNVKPISFYTIALYIWLAGVFILSFITYKVNRRLCNFTKEQTVILDNRILGIFESCKKSMSLQKNIPLLSMERISSPTVLGFVHPRLFLSKVLINEFNEPQLRHIFFHELAHIKRKDIGINWIMHCLLILNWFNPILWFAYYRMREDQELACDAYALSFMEEEEKIQYGLTIISLLEHYSNYFQAPNLANLSRNKHTLKRRMIMIKKFQKKSYRWSTLGVFSIIAVASLTLLNAHADDSNGKKIELPHTIENKMNNTVYTPPKQQENYKEMTKEEILTKMINTVDNFKTAKGEFKLHYNGTPEYSLIDYKIRLGSNPGGYSKTTNFENGTEKKSYGYFKDGIMWTINGDTGIYYEDKYLERPSSVTLSIKDAFTVDNEGNNVTMYRERPPISGEVNESLFNYEIASNYTRNLNTWEIEKQNEKLLGHNTLVIKGTKINQNIWSFRFWVDKDTGIIVKYETYNSAGNVLDYLYPTKLEINVPVDSKDLKPNLEGFKKFDRSSIRNGPSILTGNIDNQIPKKLNVQWGKAKEKTTETTILHENGNWYIFVKKGYLVDRIETNGKEGTLYLAKVSPQKSQFNFQALAQGYNVNNLKIVYE